MAGAQLRTDLPKVLNERENELLSNVLAVVDRAIRADLNLEEVKETIKVTFREHRLGLPFSHSPGYAVNRVEV